MGYLPSFISGVINVIDFLWLIEFSHAQSHPFYKVRMDEIVSGS
jgi:hypothetical protein